MNYIIQHPHTGTSIQVRHGETPEDAVERYNKEVLGYEPEGEPGFAVDPKRPEIYSESQLSDMKRQGITETIDPETNKAIDLADYIIKYYGSYFRG